MKVLRVNNNNKKLHLAANFQFMKQIKIYRILSYIILPIAALIGLMDLIIILAALVQPALLLGAFILAGVVIYTITGFIFLIKGIDRGLPCKPGLKDFIKVNAYVTVVFIAMSLIQSFALLRNDVLLKQMISEGISAQQTSLPPGYDVDKFEQIMKAALYFIMAYAAILLVHVIISFRLLKSFQHLFDKE